MIVGTLCPWRDHAVCEGRYFVWPNAVLSVPSMPTCPLARGVPESVASMTGASSLSCLPNHAVTVLPETVRPTVPSWERASKLTSADLPSSVREPFSHFSKVSVKERPRERLLIEPQRFPGDELPLGMGVGLKLLAGVADRQLKTRHPRAIPFSQITEARAIDATNTRLDLETSDGETLYLRVMLPGFIPIWSAKHRPEPDRFVAALERVRSLSH